MEKNLNNKEAVEKLKDLAESIKVCMFITDNDEQKDPTRPMTTIEVEDDGTLWFFTGRQSQKVDEVENESLVHLVYADPGKENYMDLWGNATTVTDKSIIKDKWNPIVKAWFPEGVDDPNIALLKVTPRSAYYWDTKAGKMIAFLKMAVSAITGKKSDEGVAGNLNV